MRRALWLFIFGILAIFSVYSYSNFQHFIDISIYASKSSFYVGDSTDLVVSLTNLVGNPSADVQIILNVPADVYIKGAEFVSGGKGTYTAYMRLEGGESKYVSLRLTSTTPKVFRADVKVIYRFEGESQPEFFEKELWFNVMPKDSTGSGVDFDVYFDKIKKLLVINLYNKDYNVHRIRIDTLSSDGLIIGNCRDDSEEEVILNNILLNKDKMSIFCSVGKDTMFGVSSCYCDGSLAIRVSVDDQVDKEEIVNINYRSPMAMILMFLTISIAAILAVIDVRDKTFSFSKKTIQIVKETFLFSAPILAILFIYCGLPPTEVLLGTALISISTATVIARII